MTLVATTATTTIKQQQQQQRAPSPAPSSPTASSSSASPGGEQADIPQEFLCPITLEIMSQPLTTRDGRNFERAAILSWLGNASTACQCPLTRQVLKPSDLIPNRLLETKIRNWKDANGIPDAIGGPAADTAQQQSGDVEEQDFGFYGFLNVKTPEKTNEILARQHRQRRSTREQGGSGSSGGQPNSSRRHRAPPPPMSLASLAGSGQLLSNPTSSSNAPTPSSRNNSSQQQQQQRRRFLSRILSSASRELENGL